MRAARRNLSSGLRTLPQVQAIFATLQSEVDPQDTNAVEEMSLLRRGYYGMLLKIMVHNLHNVFVSETNLPHLTGILETIAYVPLHPNKASTAVCNARVAPLSVSGIWPAEAAPQTSPRTLTRIAPLLLQARGGAGRRAQDAKRLRQYP